MKAITLYQPWATLVIKAVKRIETRSWDPTYRGQLAIHAGMTFDQSGFWWIRQKIRESVTNSVEIMKQLTEFEYPRGAVLGTVNFYDCKPTNEIQNPGVLEQILGDFGADRYGWFLKDVHEFRSPSPARGHQKLWHWVSMTQIRGGHVLRG